MTNEIRVKVNSYGPGRALTLVYVDPISGKRKTKSTGTTDWREAERLAGELEKQIQAGQYMPPSKIKWKDFVAQYKRERLASQSASSRKTAGTAFNLVERVLDPDRLCKMTTRAVSKFVATLRGEGVRDSTLASYLRTLKAALRWANRMGLLPVVPQFDMPRAGEAKARPVTAEEFDRLIEAAEVERPKDSAQWIRLLTGLWLSGLRLGEALRLSWDDDAPFAVSLSGRFPAFRIEAHAQKNRKDDVLPMTPDFGQWLLQTPEAERVGPVFPARSLYGATPLTFTKVVMVLGKIGEAARVVVARTTKRVIEEVEGGRKQLVEKQVVKYASAHDLRRAFGTRWAKQVMPAVLQRLMRHRDINTTMKYYVGIQADDIAADLWARHEAGGNNNRYNNPPSGQSNGEHGNAEAAGERRCGETS